ncbi:hypothetical protein [Dethiothermospora halolimnae]|uniref:hypothetical protein n=1 Tax=Dethiothermospora halolimnae TaxID=3114390 RepID=UPI003CCB9E5D
MEIIKLEEVKGKINPRGVESAVVLKHEDATITKIMLNQDDVLGKHKVPVNVFFYVVKGKGTIGIGDEESVVTENQIIVCPKNTMMTLKADQGENFEVINVKTPSL